MNRFNEKIFNISILLLIFMTICLVGTKLLVYFGGTENKYLFLIYILVSILIFGFSSGESVKSKIIECCIFLLILGCAILLNIHVFDFSYDGTGYHEMGIGLLAHGWNPIRESAEDFITNEGLRLMGNSHAMWIDHYASGTWTIASIFYAFTGFIESGKSINLLSILILFGIVNYYYAKWKDMKGFSYVVAFLCAVNPLSLSQLFTNYVDGLLMLYLELGILAWFVILKANNKKEQVLGFFFLFCSICFCSNIKVTGLFFIGIYTFAAYVIILVSSYKDNKLEFKRIFLKLTAILGCMVFLSVCIIGYAPYMTNMVQHRNPIYPLLSDTDIMVGQYPASFEGLGNTQRVLISLFSEVDNINVNVDREPEIKIPFTVSKNEIQHCSADTRISGFGPWFSGILICSLLYLACYVYKKRKALDKLKYNHVKIYFYAIIIISIMLTLFFEGSWWARFSMYEYFIVLSILFLLQKNRRVLNIAISTIFLINNFFFCINYIELFRVSESVRTKLEYLAEISNEENIELCATVNDWSGVQFNFEDYGIKYFTSDEMFSGDGIYWGYTYRTSLSND